VQIEKDFLDQIENIYGKENAALVEKAFNFARQKHEGQTRDTGEAYVSHPYEVAKILFGMRADIPSVVCGLLHDCLGHTDCTEKEILDAFGEEVLNILVSEKKISIIKQSRMNNPDEVDNLRNMILALGKDARVAFVKLADRLHNLQTLGVKPREKQIKIANETLDLFVPIADRMGMNKFKHKLEDMCFKFVYPEEYLEVKKYLDEYYKKSENINNEIAQTLENLTKQHGVEARIQSRIKSSFGVFKKQNAKGKDSVYDVIAHRIIVKEIKDCYTMLGAVHELWKPVEGRIKDYIAMPKKNMYMSLHTTVLYPTENGGIPFEIQIRTEEMHIFCEYGMAAHWMYKKNGSQATKFDGNSAMLDIKKKLQEENGGILEEDETADFLQTIKNGFYADTIFVFTPQLKVIELPLDSITLDFAYAVHTNLGNKCVGAKINGKMVPIISTLQTGDIVEIMTSSTSKGPSRDWTKMCKSRGAIAKIKNYFKKEKRDENIKIGKAILEEQLKRKGYSLSKFLDDKESLNEVSIKNTLLSVEDIYAAVGYGGVTTAQVLGKFISKQKQRDKLEKKSTSTSKRPAKNFDGIIVDGLGDMLKRVAKCCNPIPGDQIVGYISRGRGVTIHKADCHALAHLEKERIVETSWDEETSGNYCAEFKILAKSSANILNVVSNKIADNKIEISFINSERNRQGDVILDVGVMIKSRDQLSELINKISSMPEVYEVYR